MTLLVIILALWITSAVIRSVKETKRKRAEAQRSADLKRMTAEWRAQKAQAELDAKRMAEIEREQMRQAREQEKLAKEQEKQAAQLAKHEKRIADLEYRVSQAESDIEFLNGRIAQLDAQRDYLLLQQSGTIPGGKEHTKYQTKIISIDNQIHTAENKLDKAQHTKAMAQREMEVA